MCGCKEREEHAYLVFLEPLLDELFLPLCKHGPAQLQGLILVELTALQENAKVLQQWRGLPGRGGHLLEFLDGLRRTQNTLQGKQSHVCTSDSLKQSSGY